MVRGVIVVIFTIFLMIVGLLVATAAIEPIGDQAEKFDSIDDGPLDGTNIIDDVKTSVFEYMPLIVIGGIILWAFRWYLRRERFIGGR